MLSIPMHLTERMFKKCVGRPPREGEMQEFADLWSEYEWEDLISGDWSEHFTEGGE